MEKIRKSCENYQQETRGEKADLEKVDRFLNSIRKGQFDFNLALEAQKELEKSDELKMAYRRDLLMLLGNNAYMDVWVYSFVLKLMPEKSLFNDFIEYIGGSTSLNWQNKYFLACQLTSFLFQTPEMNLPDTYSNTWKLLQIALEECKGEIGVSLEPIAPEERDSNMVVVLVEQYLTESHGPTKTVLDRCSVLQDMNKKVFLINTTEKLSMAGAVPFFDASIGNKIDSYAELNRVSWKGHQIPFYQCEKEMPNIGEMQQLLAAVRRLKPSAIVLVGGNSLFAGLANELVPVLTVGTLHSTLAMTLTDYQMLDENLIPKYMSILETMGIARERIIPGLFTFSLKEQTEHVTRADVGIPEDSFALAVVGGRLDDEISEDFLSMLEGCETENLFVGILGKCDLLQEKLERHEKLKECVKYLGFCSDILSRIEHFDLYINPLRRGGGTSSIEALSKGIPVITINYGDVAGVVGADFQCDNYDEMAQLIDRYQRDKAFYQGQSKLAKIIAGVYLDSAKEFVRIMREYSKLMMAHENNKDEKKVLQKKKLKIALLHGAENNAGDFLIRNRSRALIMHYYPDCELTEYYRNRRFSDAVLEEINKNDISILAGGPACYNGFYPVMEYVMKLRIPLFALGLGWFGFDETPIAVYNDIFDEKMIHALKRLEMTSGTIGCRDFNTVHVLRNCGIRRTMMTGCPAWYNLDKVGQKHYEGPTLKECRKICISDCGDANHLQSLLEVLVMAREFFGPDKSIYFVTHKPDAQLYLGTISDLLEEHNIKHIDISGSGDGFKFYDDCDIHIGFRVHAHIYMLSERKLSILVEEDARGGGVNSALGLPNICAFWSTVGDNQLQHIPNSFVVREIQDYLFDLHENNYVQMDQAYMMMNRYFKNMETHIKSIEKRV